MSNNSLFKVLRLVSLGDALGFGSEGGILEYSTRPFSEPLITEIADDIMNVTLTPDRFPISDDSITTHLTLYALFQALRIRQQAPSTGVELSDPHQFATRFAHNLLQHLIELQGMPDPVERSWGRMMVQLWERFPSGQLLPSKEVTMERITPFDCKAGGNGGAMHAIPIGLLFHQVSSSREREFLIATAVESGRVTHNHPTGFLGSVLVAFFAACAVEKRKVETWAVEFLDKILPEVRSYLRSTNSDLKEYDDGFEYFESKWRGFVADLSRSSQVLKATGESAHEFIKRYAFGFVEGDSNCHYWSGSSGHDVAMYAIYGLLSCQGNYRSFIDVVCNHPGDSDTTGAVALPLFGLMFGFDQIPHNHLDHLERNEMLLELCDAAFPFFSHNLLSHF